MNDLFQEQIMCGAGCDILPADRKSAWPRFVAVSRTVRAVERICLFFLRSNTPFVSAKYVATLIMLAIFLLAEAGGFDGAAGDDDMHMRIIVRRGCFLPAWNAVITRKPHKIKLLLTNFATILCNSYNGSLSVQDSRFSKQGLISRQRKAIPCVEPFPFPCRPTE